jgi:hypothetical protein
MQQFTQRWLAFLLAWAAYLFFPVPATAHFSDTSLIDGYLDAYEKLQAILQQNGSFKEAVFISENAYFRNNLSEDLFYEAIHNNKNIIQAACTNSKSANYKNRDSSNYQLNYTISKLYTDTIAVTFDGKQYTHAPFRYSFTDPLGKQDWGNMLVTKLLATHQGNCHSLAYLYKILANETGATCWLALAPNHMYIKNYSEKTGWYNTELTSGTFPTDAWLMSTGYVNPEAIKSGLYMDTLSNQQSIALCVLDLAKAYAFQTHRYYDGFILQCCNLALKYHPVNPMALLLKAETLKKIYVHEYEMNDSGSAATLAQMQQAYITLAKLGYREMPEKMYRQWLQEITMQKQPYKQKPKR